MPRAKRASFFDFPGENREPFARQLTQADATAAAGMFLPGPSNILSAIDAKRLGGEAVQQFGRGDILGGMKTGGSAGLAAIGAIPGIGAVAKLATKTAKLAVPTKKAMTFERTLDNDFAFFTATGKVDDSTRVRIEYALNRNKVTGTKDAQIEFTLDFGTGGFTTKKMKDIGLKKGSKVLATVKETIDGFIKATRPTSVSFGADREELVDLYGTIARVIEKETGGKLSTAATDPNNPLNVFVINVPNPRRPGPSIADLLQERGISSFDTSGAVSKRLDFTIDELREISTTSGEDLEKLLRSGLE